MKHSSSFLSWTSTLQILALCAPAWVHAQAPSAPAEAWMRTAPLVTPRAKTCAVLLQDGRVLMTGGVDAILAPLSSSEFFGSDGTFTSGPVLTAARSQHTCTVLNDGRVLVSGGRDNSGPLSSAEIFDPSSNTFRPSGDLVEARFGQTASLLADGRVLLAGGQDGSGPKSTLELFDPVANTFRASESVLASPRSGHAALVYPTGLVLIAGGTDGSVSLASVDVYDPLSDTTFIGPALTTGRTGLSATLLADNRILVVGGNDGQSDLACTEVYDPNMGVFQLTGSLETSRSGHLAILLPGNNDVLIAGGVSAGTVLNSSELFDHEKNVFRTVGPLTAGRTNASVTPLAQSGTVLAVGGSSAPLTDGASNSLIKAGGVFSGFATLTVTPACCTFLPGQTVGLTGTGWLPGEQVNILPCPRAGCSSLTLVQASSVSPACVTGGCFNVPSYYRPADSDVPADFSVTAISAVSGKRADSIIHIRAPSRIAVTASNIPVIGNNVTLRATITGGFPNRSITAGSQPITFLDGATTLGGATAVASGGALTATFSTSNFDNSLTGSSHRITAVYGGDPNYAAATSPVLALTVGKGSPRVLFEPLPLPILTVGGVRGKIFAGAFRQTPIGPFATGSMAFSIDGSLVANQPLDAAGEASFPTPVSLTAGTHAVTAQYAGDPNFLSASTPSPLNLTVYKGATTIILIPSGNPTHMPQPLTLTATVQFPADAPLPLGAFRSTTEVRLLEPAPWRSTPGARR